MVLDDCAASKDMKGRTGELLKLSFSARHTGIILSVAEENDPITGKVMNMLEAEPSTMPAIPKPEISAL